MAEPTVLTPEQVQAIVGALGQQPNIIKQNGRVYQVQADGSAREVTGIPPEAIKQDTNPTTIHVVGKGWLEYRPEAGGWGVIQGTEETPDAAKQTIVEGGDGKKYTVTIDAQGNPKGTEVAGIPGNPAPAPTRTADQIAAESQANVAQSQASAAASRASAAHSTASIAGIETPAQAQQRQIAVAVASAQAQAKAAAAQLDAEIKSGAKLPEQGRIALEHQHRTIEASLRGSIDRINAEYTHTLEQPNIEANRAIQQQQADTQSANQQSNAANQQQQAKQAEVERQTGVLKQQSAQGYGFLDTLTKAGVRASSASVGMATNPLIAALQIGRGLIATGEAPPNSLPTPRAPAPGGPPKPPGAPVPTPQPYRHPGGGDIPGGGY